MQRARIGGVVRLMVKLSELDGYTVSAEGRQGTSWLEIMLL